VAWEWEQPYPSYGVGSTPKHRRSSLHQPNCKYGTLFHLVTRMERCRANCPGGEFTELWATYTRALKGAHIRISKTKDELVWKNSPHGTYTPKLGYSQLNIDLHQREPSWWWRGLWKIKFPLKARIFMWCLVKNKIPTWDRMKQRNVEGPSWCALCKANDELGVHLFISCPFVKQIWEECSQALGQASIWQGHSIEEAWKEWLSHPMN
jgi:hypothetical protein